MYRLETPGLLIAVEGIDAAGSSSLVTNLTKAMNKRGLKTFPTKEPTDNLVGGLIRGALTHEWKPSPRTLQQLFVADRSHHLDRMILLNLRKGHHVISDRYIWSTLAFGGVDLELVELLMMNQAYPAADLTFVVNVAVETTQVRLDQRDHLELFEKKSYQEMVRDNYLELAERFPSGAVVLDGQKPEEELTKEALALVLDHPLLQTGQRIPQPFKGLPNLEVDLRRVFHGLEDEAH